MHDDNLDVGSHSSLARHTQGHGALSQKTRTTAAIKALSIAAGVVVAFTVFQKAMQAQQASAVIEVVTMKLKPDVIVAEFEKVDHETGTQYVAKRSGFLSRESAPGADHSWLAIVHWRSAADADASMKNFSTSAEGKKLMTMIAPDSMVMTRYGR